MTWAGLGSCLPVSQCETLPLVVLSFSAMSSCLHPRELRASFIHFATSNAIEAAYEEASRYGSRAS